MTLTIADQLRAANSAELGRFLEWLEAPVARRVTHSHLPRSCRVIDTFAVTGSRTWAQPRLVEYALGLVPAKARMLHGAARGLDTLAAAYWTQRGGAVEAFPVTNQQWRDIGRRAGIVRNEVMLNRMPDLLLAWIDQHSPGATHAVSYAKERGIPTFVFRS